MTVDTQKEKICINKIVEEKNEVVTIEADTIVPDVKPDVIASISTCGNICIYKKEILDGRVRIDGCIDAYVIYLTEAEDSIIRGLNTSIDFTHMMEIPNCNQNMNLELDTCLKGIDCKVLNGRKINLKTNIEFRVKVYENKEEEVIRQIEGVENIQKQNKVLQINSLVGSGNTKVVAKDTLAVEEGCNFGEILKANCVVTNKEYKISYNKILVKADASVKIMYLTEENSIKTLTSEIPVMGFIDLPDVSEENICDINYLLKNIIIKPNNTEEHSISVEAEIDIDAKAYNTKDIEIIDDLYNPDCNIEFTTKDIETITQKNNCNEKVAINENINLNEIQNILDIEANPTITNINMGNDKIIYEGEINLKILFQSNTSSRIETKQIDIPFNTQINTNVTSNIKISNNIEITKQSFNANGSNLEVNIELNLMASMYKTVSLKIIDTLQMEEYEEENECGMTIYFVKKADTLWNIAKKFRTTIDQIVQTNQLENENKIEIGQQLFIPNYNSNKKRKLA